MISMSLPTVLPTLPMIFYHWFCMYSNTMIFISLPTVLHILTMIFYQWFTTYYSTMILMSLPTVLHTSTMILYQWFHIYYSTIIFISVLTISHIVSTVLLIPTILQTFYQRFYSFVTMIWISLLATLNIVASNGLESLLHYNHC